MVQEISLAFTIIIVYGLKRLLFITFGVAFNFIAFAK